MLCPNRSIETAPESTSALLSSMSGTSSQHEATSVSLTSLELDEYRLEMRTEVAVGRAPSAPVPVALLHQLCRDEAFRQELAENPYEALTRRGIYVDPKAVPAVISLPSREAVADVCHKVDPGDSVVVAPWLPYFV